MLVLHLKRFLFDKTGGSQKLMKHVPYRMELEVGRGVEGGREGGLIVVGMWICRVVQAHGIQVSLLLIHHGDMELHLLGYSRQHPPADHSYHAHYQSPAGIHFH